MSDNKQPVDIFVWDYWTFKDKFYIILEFHDAPGTYQYSNLVFLEGTLY